MLRKLSLLGIVAASMLILTACGGGSANTPDGVAKAFLEEIADKDFSGAKKYATKASASMLDMMESTMSMVPDDIADESSDEFEITKTDENGDEATVYYTSGGKDEKLKVVKEDGDWKVAFSKQDQMEEGMDDAMGGDSDGGDMDLDFGDLGDSLDAALEELDDALEELGEELGKAGDDHGHDHDDHEGHEH